MIHPTHDFDPTGYCIACAVFMREPRATLRCCPSIDTSALADLAPDVDWTDHTVSTDAVEF